MDKNSFILGTAVGIAATVIGGVILAAILGTWRGLWRYVSSMFNDMRMSLSAAKQGKYQEATAHDNRATMKLLGCECLGLLLTILFVVAVVIVMVVAASANPHH